MSASSEYATAPPSPLEPTPDSPINSLLPSASLSSPILSPRSPSSLAKPSKISPATRQLDQLTSHSAESTLRPLTNFTSCQSTIRPSFYTRNLNEYWCLLDDFVSSQGSGTVVPMKVAIDEMSVEGCVLCGKEGESRGMELRVMDIGEVVDTVRKGEKGEKGVWWVCRGDCGI